MTDKEIAVAHVNLIGVFGHFCGLDDVVGLCSDMMLVSGLTFNLTPPESQGGLGGCRCPGKVLTFKVQTPSPHLVAQLRVPGWLLTLRGCLCLSQNSSALSVP